MSPDEMRDHRKMANMSQAALAEGLGMNRVTVNKMENGEAPIEKRTGLAVLHLIDQQKVFTRETEAAVHDVPLADAMILWESDGSVHPPVRVLPHGDVDDQRYSSSGGAAWTHWRAGSDLSRLVELFVKVQEMTVIEKIDPVEIHRALSVIPEYRAALYPDPGFKVER